MAVENVKKVDGKLYICWGSELTGRQVYCRLGDTAKQLTVLEDGKNVNYHYRMLYNKLKTLKDTSSIFVSQANCAHTDRRLCRMSLVGATIEYFMRDGASFITRLVICDERFHSDKVTMKAPGAYTVIKREDEWSPERHVDQINTLHASINGEVEDIDEVMLFMAHMITKAFKNEGEITGKGRYRGFTHLYMPGKNSRKFGWRDMVSRVPLQGTETFKAARETLVDRTAACIQIASQKSQQVKWTIQGSGSEIFCDAVEKLTKANPKLNLSNQSAHFFNSHTDPMRIKNVVERAGGKEEYTSALKSSENIKAMSRGHRQYTKEKYSKTVQEKPGHDRFASQLEARKIDTLIEDYQGMAVTLGTLTVTAAGAIHNPQVLISAAKGVVSAYMTGLQIAPVATIGGSMLAAASLYKTITATSPKMLKMARLGVAALKHDRRLDQLTESNYQKAFNQFNELKLGRSI